MKVLVLAAGYGTRLEKGIRDDTTGKYSHLLGLPKPLVPLAGKPLITYWLDHLRKVPGVGDPKNFIVVTNAHYYDMFLKWAKANGVPADNIINDGTTSNETRLGAISDMALAVERHKIDDDLMVVGGDTLFLPSFSLNHCMDTFGMRAAPVASSSSSQAPKGFVPPTKPFANLVLWYGCSDEEVKSTGVLELDDHQLVTAFLEKPAPTATKSRNACPCLYFYDKGTLPLFSHYTTKVAETQFQRDAPGRFVEWVHSRSPTYAYPVEGRWDIGGLDTYVEADDAFRAYVAGEEKQSSEDES